MNKIKELRKEKNMSQKDLAVELGVAQNTLSTWEIGRYDPDFNSLIKIADFFGVSTDYILGRSDEKKLATDEGGEHINTVVIRNRDGKVIQKQYTDKKLEKIMKMIDLLAEEDSDL